MQSKGTTQSQQLESFIIKQLLKTSGVFKGTEAAGSSLTADMFADTLSEAVANGGGFGIASMLNPAPQSQPLQLSQHNRVTSGFGDRKDPITGERSHHTGVDLAAAEGTPIPAA